MQAERQTLTRFDTEIAELEQAIKEKRVARSEMELALKKFDHEIANLKKDKATAHTRVRELESLHHWIKEERK